jgi:hypothetical protein
MGGGTDGASSLIVGLPGRPPSDALHAAITSGTLLLSISGPGVEAEPITARGMRCISQVARLGGQGEEGSTPGCLLLTVMCDAGSAPCTSCSLSY